MTTDPTIANYDFPARPDWAWLRFHWQHLHLLRQHATLQDIARRAQGRTACLATPYGCGAPELETDIAATWLHDLAQVGICALSPAFMAGCQGRKGATPDLVMQACDFVIVPPAVGWRAAPDVWAAVCLALPANKPVYLMEGCN